MTGLLRCLCAAALAFMPQAAAAAERVVIAGASFVEIAHALGAGERVVGVDRTATHPPETADAANIGYFRQLAPEGILALAPDLVIAAADAGPPRTFAILESAGVAVLRGPEADGPDEVTAKIRFMGEALGLVGEADRLAADYDARLAATLARLPEGADPPRVLFVLAIEGGAPIVGGRGTAPDAMLRAAGLANAAEAVEGFKPMGPEAIVAAAPDALLMMPGHADRAGGLDAVLDGPGLSLTPAGRERRAMTMEGALLMRFGPRTPEAIATLATRLGR